MEDFLNELTGSTKKNNQKSSPKSDSNQKKRRPPSSNRKILQFLDDLSINDDNDDKPNNIFDDNNEIYKLDSDSNKSEGDQTEIKYNNTIFDNFKYNHKQPRSESFESSIISYLDLSLRDLSSDFLTTIADLSEETFDKLYTEKVSNFLNDLNSEINDIFQSMGNENYDPPQFETDEIINDITSQMDEINQQIPSKEGQYQDDNSPSKIQQTSFSEFSTEINLQKSEMIRFSSEILNDIKIERNKLLINSMEKTVMTQPNLMINKENDEGTNFINDFFIDFEKKQIFGEIEKKFIDDQLNEN